ncbi:MAG TPA: 2Fe-2S iron-sulfur cluster-binding protein [Pseudonocardia sp.]|jgi:2Fe-2S ferredoxin|nr:2Fe-2S iron-sulfur cluster-binding protein [Pseudonocardia sp.]
MVTVWFVAAHGTRHEVKVRAGVSLMRGAIDAGISEIVGECGGNAMCATCHVYLEGDPGRGLPPVSEVEDAMLDETATPRRATSRLSCQITADPDLDGITVHLPAAQI